MAVEAARAVGVPDSRSHRRYFSVQDDKHSRAPAEQARWFEIVPVATSLTATAWALHRLGQSRPMCRSTASEDVSGGPRVRRRPQTPRRRLPGGGLDRPRHRRGDSGSTATTPPTARRLDRIAREWVSRGYFVIEKRKDGGRKEREYLVPARQPRHRIQEAIGGGAAVENPLTGAALAQPSHFSAVRGAALQSTPL
jgi:hypothetical protein